MTFTLVRFIRAGRMGTVAINPAHVASVSVGVDGSVTVGTLNDRWSVQGTLDEVIHALSVPVPA